MKLNGRHVLMAVLALILGSIPAIALAQSGSFPSSNSAAGDQYGTSTTTTTGTTTTITTTTPTTTTVTTGTTVTNGTTVTTVVTTTPTVTGQGTTTPTDTTGGNGGGGGGGNGNGGGGGGGNGGGGSNGQGNGGDNGGNAPGGRNGRTAGAGAGDEGQDAADPRITAPYVTITLSPVNLAALQNAHKVTGTTAYDANITEPLDVAVIKELTAGTKWAGAESDNKKLAAFARTLGRSIVDGGVLAKTAFPKLATGVEAKYIHPLSGAVLIHTDQPLEGADAKRRDAFIKNLVKGLKKAKVPTVNGGKIAVPLVGVELSTQKTTVPFFKALGVSTVDNVEQSTGQTSLSRVLNGAKGHFGVKKVSKSGKVAKRPTNASPLLYRPTASYTPGELLRESDGGLPGGGATVGILLLVSLMSVVALLAVVERRTRATRRRRTSV